MSSRPRVTITLGRDGGQVVKRARPTSNDNEMPSTGGKHAVRERLGSSMVEANMYGNQYMNKRQRTEANGSSLGDKALDNAHIKSHRHIGRGDLRLKLLNKSLSRGTDISKGKRNIDLRQKLSRNRQVSYRYHAQEHLKESNTSGSVRHLPPTRTVDGRLPPTRSADDLLQLDTQRKSYSLWAFEGRRHRSPHRLISTSRGLSSPRRYEELQHTPSMRSMDASRPSSSVTNGLIDASRSVPYTSKTAAAFHASKAVAQALPGPVAAQRSLLMSNEPLKIESLLHSLDLDKYNVIFKAEEVDMTALRQMGDNDLKEMGIPMGPRKKILLALSHSRQRRR